MLCPQCHESHDYTILVCVLSGSGHGHSIFQRCWELEYWLQEGQDPNELSWSEGRLPIYRCFRDFSMSFLPILLKYGADINKKDSDRMTPLDYACRSMFGIKELLQSGADPRLGDPVNKLLTCYKIWTRQTDDPYRKGTPSPTFDDVCDSLRLLIKYGAQITDENLGPHHGWNDDHSKWDLIPVDPRLKKIMFTEISCFKRHLDNPETKEIRDRLDQIHPFWRDILKEKENSLQYQALRKVLLDLKF